jgi:uncharacterized YigZ family protein
MHCVVNLRYFFEETIKKSRFIGVLIPCQCEKDIENSLKELHSKHPHASHIAYAYRIITPNGTISRFHDAGEPGGTAGKPIFQHLEGKELINVLLAVIRYFGGVKLGAGGLTRAYGNTAKHVIEIADFHPYVALVDQQLTLDYKQIPLLEQVLKKLDGSIITKDFGVKIRLTVQLPQQNLDALLDVFSAQPSH